MLEACVARKTILTRFEPERATLHDAFVTLVGGQHIADAMTAEQEEAS